MRLGYLPEFSRPAADERSQHPALLLFGRGSRLATTNSGRVDVARLHGNQPGPASGAPSGSAGTRQEENQQAVI